MNKEKKICAACKHENILSKENQFDLKNIPPVDFYSRDKQKCKELYKHPIGIYVCEKCGLVQVKDSPDQKLFYENYIYESSSSRDMKNNFEELIKKIQEYKELNSEVHILDIGCNDGLLLKEIKKKSSKVKNLAGIDPSPISGQLNKLGIKIEKNYFPKTSKFQENEFDIITSTNAFAHIPNIAEATEKVVSLLKDQGLFIVEVSDFDKMNELKAWDYIYHEHLFYYTKDSIMKLLEAKGLKVIEIQEINTKGGSIRVIAKKEARQKEKEKKERVDKGKNSVKRIQTMQENYRQWKQNKDKFFEEHSGMRFIGYGACATASVTIAQSKKFNQLDYIIDDNKKRQNTFAPATTVEVKGLNAIKFQKNDIIIVFAWRFIKEIKQGITEYCNRNNFYQPKVVRSIDMKEWRGENE